MKKTCCSLNCPFILVCKKCNFLVDRGEKCETMEFIIEKSANILKDRKKQSRKKST